MPRAAQQGLDRLAQGGIDVIALDQYMPGLDGLETLERILNDPGCAAGGVRHGLAGFRDRRHRAEGGRRRLSGQGHAGRFHPPAPGRRQRRAAQAQIQQGPRRGRGRGPRLARPLCGACRRARGAAARSQPPRRQLAADHRLAAASAGQFEYAGRRQGGADQCDGPRRRGRPGASPALHLARSEERAAEPVSRCAARGPPALRRRQQDVAADAEGRADRDRSGPRGGDRHHRQRAGHERREIRLPRRRRPDPRRAQGAGRRSRAVDRRRRRRPQRQDRPALHRHGAAHRRPPWRRSSKPASSAIPTMPAPGSCCGSAASTAPAAKSANAAAGCGARATRRIPET